jgi:hypothetical protein
VKFRLVSSLGLLLSVGTLRPATLERLSLDDMVAKSTAIVRGKITDSYAAFSGRVIYTHYTVQVSERFKGAERSTVDVAVPGGVTNKLRQTFEGAPVFHRGEEYVFFLWTGASGPTQVVGLTQGLFSIAGGGSRDPAATRAASHEVMLAAGTGRPVKDQTMVMPLNQLRSRIAASLAAKSGSVAK